MLVNQLTEKNCIPFGNFYFIKYEAKSYRVNAIITLLFQELVKRARAEKWNVWSLQGGLSTFTDTLKAKLEALGVKIEMNAKLDKSHVSSQGTLEGHTIWTTPACSTAQYFKDDLAGLLASIPFVDVAVVNLTFQGNLFPDPAFGFLVPSTEKNVPILGVIYDSCTFPQFGNTVLTVMMGGAWFHPLFGQSPDIKDLERVAVDQVQKILKVKQEPSRVICKIQRQCIAQYTVGHVQRVQKLRGLVSERKLNVAFTGSSYDGVGINDAIMSSKKHVDKLFN